MAYTKTTWVNGNLPALNETNLNNMETGIYEAHSAIATLQPLVSANTTAISSINSRKNRRYMGITWEG